MRGEAAPVSVLLLALAALAVPARADETRSAADRAFEAGNHEEALALYDEVLAGAPDDVHALVQSGKLLSWQQRYAEALARYDRCLASEPGHPVATLERAKVLSWDRQFGAAAAAFRGVLERDPGHREARLGLARSLSWGGDQRPAREEYERLLERDAADPEALVGVAQTYAWSGDPQRAREWYDKALVARPQMKEAELGLAYLDLWDGDHAAARERTARLERAHPGDGDVAELRQAIAKASAPWVDGNFDFVSDTDGNDLGVLRVESGTLAFARRLDLRGGLTRWDMRDVLSRSANATALYGVLGWSYLSRQRLELRLGVNRLENTSGDTDDVGIGGVTWLYRPRRPWDLRASLGRDPYLYATTILDNAIMIDALEVSGAGRPADRWRIEGSTGYWDLSDGNSRVNLRVGGWYGWQLRPVTVEAGWVLQYQAFAEELDNGYFDPTDFVANLPTGRVRGKFGSTRYYYEAELALGLQSFTVNNVSVDNDFVVGGRATFGFPLPAGVSLEVYAAYTDYALQSATGFSSSGAGIRVRWRGGN